MGIYRNKTLRGLVAGLLFLSQTAFFCAEKAACACSPRQATSAVSAPACCVAQGRTDCCLASSRTPLVFTDRDFKFFSDSVIPASQWPTRQETGPRNLVRVTFSHFDFPRYSLLLSESSLSRPPPSLNV